MTADGSTGTQATGSSRSELARLLLARTERLASRLGDVSVAVEIQLLKRELSRGHDVLASRREERDFLSVVTLVEAALASLTWKRYTTEVVDALREAFTSGAREEAFTFSDYDAVRRNFAALGIPTAPSIDLTSVAAAAEDEDDSQA
jgi:hypothetical protein